MTILLRINTRPGFPVRCGGNYRVCGFHQGKPRELRQRHEPRQEIRGMPRQIVILRPRSWSKPVNASGPDFPVTFRAVSQLLWSQKVRSSGPGRAAPRAGLAEAHNCSFFSAARQEIRVPDRIQLSACLPPCRYDDDAALTNFFSACSNQPVCRCLRPRRADRDR